MLRLTSFVVLAVSLTACLMDSDPELVITVETRTNGRLFVASDTETTVWLVDAAGAELGGLHTDTARATQRLSGLGLEALEGTTACVRLGEYVTEPATCNLCPERDKYVMRAEACAPLVVAEGAPAFRVNAVYDTVEDGEPHQLTVAADFALVAPAE